MASALVLILPLKASAAEALKIGWASADITPDRPVAMRGRELSEGVKDPVTATALALERGAGEAVERVILVSCDLQHITDGNRYEANMLAKVRALLQTALPEVPSGNVILMATHTHVAPSVQTDKEYEVFASERIARAAAQAWESRKPGGVSYGLGHAVIGHNRIVTHQDGSSRMVGDLQKGTTAHSQFSHIEGFEDHSVHLLFAWDETSRLTGVVINVPCPAQVQRGKLISADYWHEAREEIRRRLGEDVFILPQVSAAGDLATIVMVEKKAEARMQRLMFPEIEDDRDRRRKQIALRLADAVSTVLPFMKDAIEWNPPLAHSMKKLELVQGFPEPKPDMPPYPVELHAVRIGEVAMVTNPFEFYLDYGIRIKGRSPAVQTFVVQLAGSGSYLPTDRAVAGGAYGAIPRTSRVGPQAGQAIVEATLEMLGDLFKANETE